MSKILIKNLQIYNDIYGLNITEIERDLFDALFTMFKGSNLTYIYNSGPNNKDLVLRFNGYDDALYLELPDATAKKFGYKLFKLRNARYYLKFVPKQEDIKYINIIGDIGNKEQQAKEFSTLDDLKQHILDNDLPSFLSNFALTQIKIETLYWLCNKLDQYKPSLFNDPNKYEKLPDYIHYIVDVIQLMDDTRIALYAEVNHGCRTTMIGYSIKFYITKPDNASYNWTDPDRYCSNENEKTGQPKVFYIGPDPEFPEEEALNKYIRGHEHIVIENSTLTMIAKRDERKKIEDAVVEKAQAGIQKKLTDKIAELETGGEFTFNDVTFKAHSIEYESHIIKSNNVKVKYLLGNFIRNLRDDSFNFENIFTAFCKTVITEAQNSGRVKMQIGNINVTLEVRKKVNSAGTTMVTNYINDYRINKDELVDVLPRALCYNKDEDYDNYLESVSKCSLRYHRAIAAGIILQALDEITGETVDFKIGLERDKNRNYISFGDKSKYVVKDSNKLLNLIGVTSMSRIIDILVDPDIVGITGSDIKYIIETGRKVWAEERTKEQEMLSQTIALFNCQKMEDALLDNGRVVSGYTVKGKLREYIVETSTIRVFEYPSGKYLCMVDKGQNEHANIARLVNRMFALANDSRLANEITTLQTK
jgi:hypothetical protein